MLTFLPKPAQQIITKNDSEKSSQFNIHLQTQASLPAEYSEPTCWPDCRKCDRSGRGLEKPQLDSAN